MLRSIYDAYPGVEVATIDTNSKDSNEGYNSTGDQFVYCALTIEVIFE